MDKETIAKQARKASSKEQLLGLLNQIQKDEMTEMGMADKFKPFAIRHLSYYSNPKNVKQRYTQFRIKKKSGGMRLITAPKGWVFRSLLRCVNKMFQALYTPSDYAMGFAQGRSVATNAQIHVGQRYVLNIDLKDFFPSIEQARVWKRIQAKPIGLSQPVANVVAGLCAMKDTLDGKVRYVLPQGAPTSPIITNMICDRLDHRLGGLAKRFGLRYSRYADDITFSSMHYVYREDGMFWQELRRIIQDQGFRLNPDKTRLQKLGSRQEVTGVIVSHKINVTQNYVRNIRNILYIWDRYGYDTAYGLFLPRYKADKGHIKKGTPDMANVISGKLLYLKMIKGEGDSIYLRLKNKFDKLCKELDSSSETSANGKTKILTSATMPEFETKHHTEIHIIATDPVIDESIDKLFSEDTTQESRKPSRKPHRYAWFMMGGKKHLASISKALTYEDLQQKQDLTIRHCVDSKREHFWLIIHTPETTQEEEQSTQSNSSQALSEPVDINDLNNDLDSLLR